MARKPAAVQEAPEQLAEVNPLGYGTIQLNATAANGGSGGAVATDFHIPFSSVTGLATLDGSNNINFGHPVTLTGLQLTGNFTTTASPNNITLFYAWDGGSHTSFASGNSPYNPVIVDGIAGTGTVLSLYVGYGLNAAVNWTGLSITFPSTDLVATVANGSTASFPVNWPFNAVTVGQMAYVDSNGFLNWGELNIAPSNLLFSATVTFSVNTTVHIYAGWDSHPIQQISGTIVTANNAVTLTNLMIPGTPGTVLKLSATVDNPGTLTWSGVQVNTPITAGPPGQNTLQAHIATGSATVTSPTYAAMTFDTVTTNYGVVITSGNLVFPAAVTYPLLFEISAQIATSAIVYVRYQWDSQTPVTFITQSVLANAATILSGTIPAASGTTLKLSISTNVSSNPVNWSMGYINYNTTPPTIGSAFPAFTPLVPPPLIGVGGGPPPTFPPPTPPPIGAIPPGVLVGPAIAAAAVPPSTAGIPLIRFTFGSATTPPASAAFPEFTTTFPSPPIVFSNIFTDGVSPTTPPSTASTLCIALSNNYGPPIGPALPPVVPVSRPFMVATNGDPSDVVYVEPATEVEPNGEVYDDSDEENADWVEDTTRRPPSKPKRGRRK